MEPRQIFLQPRVGYTVLQLANVVIFTRARHCLVARKTYKLKRSRA